VIPSTVDIQLKGKQKELHSTEMAFRDEQEKLSKVKDQISLVQIEKAKVDTQMEVLEQEIFKILGQEVYLNIQEKKIVLNTPDAENRI
jgi:predicted  nucleic acid-binding Zn-ribbon protein